jgi:membrane peptidoglycan carboxypeptidase
MPTATDVRRSDGAAPVEPARRPARRLRKVPVLLVLLLAAGLLMAAVLVPLVLGTGLVAKSSADYFNELPDELSAPVLGRDTRLLNADGSVLAVLHDPENRLPVTIKQIPQAMQTAIIDIEDSRFYSHHGVDTKGLARAAVRNGESGGVAQGGSTITQQYVKNVLLNQAATAAEQQDARAQNVGRKLREARLALAVEKQMPKDKILEGYLNLAYFGNGAYGIGAAAERYFGIPVQKLNVAQAAMLAGLVQSPTQYDPLKNPQDAKVRRDEVLDRMQQLGHLSPQQATFARATGLGLAPVPPPAQGDACVTSIAPFFCNYVRTNLANDPALGSSPEARLRRLNAGGLTIRTTLDPKVQRAAQNAVENASGSADPVAVSDVVMRPGTGEILAMAVSRAYGTGPGQTTLPLPTSPFLQPGSTFKTFTMATALQQGLPLSTRFFSPACFVSPSMDNPTNSKGSGCPRGYTNAEPDEIGSYAIPEGTWKSVNTFYVQLEQKVGVLNVRDMAVKLGVPAARFDKTSPSGAVGPSSGSLTLGGWGVSPLDMATAYATLAASGERCDPTYVTQSLDGNNRPMPLTNRANCRQVLDPQVADTVTGVLEGVITNGTGNPNAAIGRVAAGKTGTTDNFYSAWFVGYTREFATAVAIGDVRDPIHNPLSNRSIGGRYYGEMFGGDLPAQTWSRTMRNALSGVSTASMPPAVPGQGIQGTGQVSGIGQGTGTGTGFGTSTGFGTGRGTSRFGTGTGFGTGGGTSRFGTGTGTGNR